VNNRHQGVEMMWSHVTVYLWRLDTLSWMFYIPYAMGAVVTTLSVLTIDHFELLGLRQV
jgi:hypothetical protein